ncbi:MAG: hypothetical protein M3R24_30445 [Chloroflexota bacterium]|nr:hypothetical protein [Chloroflexota bacterium]
MAKVWTPIKVLVTARTYPAPARKGIEVSCTGGITEAGQWIRLFPVPYRFLDEDKRFRKYQWIELSAAKASDARPESYQPDLDSIRIVSAPLPTAANWKARRDVISRLQAPSLCWLQRERDKHKVPTLGFFKPREIVRLVIEPDSRTWTPEELARLRQYPLFGSAPAQELEKIPFKFKYQFFCDDVDCHGHELSCLDWEMGQSYRSWARKYTDWQAMFRLRYEKEMIENFDTHFFVGTVHMHPGAWIIVGLFYPPAQQLDQPVQLTLL